MSKPRLTQVLTCIRNHPSGRRLQISHMMESEILEDMSDWPVIEHDHQGRPLIAGVTIVAVPSPHNALWVGGR